MWLGVWGPLDLNALKEWQTLLSALVALAAATIAYRVGMAKVNLDRELAVDGKRLGLQLRLSFALNQLWPQAASVADATNPFKLYNKQKIVPISTLTILEPPEIAEAWGNLELLSKDVNLRLLIIRSALQHLNITISAHSQEEMTVSIGGPSDNIHNSAAAVANACKNILAELTVELGYYPLGMADKDTSPKVPL